MARKWICNVFPNMSNYSQCGISLCLEAFFWRCVFWSQFYQVLNFWMYQCCSAALSLLLYQFAMVYKWCLFLIIYTVNGICIFLAHRWISWRRPVMFVTVFLYVYVYVSVFRVNAWVCLKVGECILYACVCNDEH